MLSLFLSKQPEVNYETADVSARGQIDFTVRRPACGWVPRLEGHAALQFCHQFLARDTKKHKHPSPLLVIVSYRLVIPFNATLSCHFIERPHRCLYIAKLIVRASLRYRHHGANDSDRPGNCQSIARKQPMLRLWDEESSVGKC